MVRANKQRNWLKNAFSIDESTFPEEQLQAVRDYWSKMSGGRFEVDPIYCQFYTQATGKFDPRYIPDDFQYWVLEAMYLKNDYNYWRALSEKNYLDLVLKGIKLPETLLHCINGEFLDAGYRPLTKEEALEALRAESPNGFIKKISVASCGGAGVSFAEPGNNDPASFLSVYDGKYYIIQKLIHQHPDMAVFNESSVNSIRILSLRRNGTVYIVSTVVRMGSAGSRVDNFSSGGACCGIAADGTIKDCVYDAKGNKLDGLPSGAEVSGKKLPAYDKICEQVKLLHNRFPQFGIISWDFAVDELGDPVLLEYNVGRGGIHVHQLCNGPLYGDMTELLLNEAFGISEPSDEVADLVVLSAGLNTEGFPYLTWRAFPGVKQYEIYRGIGKDGPMTKMFTTEKTSYTNLAFEKTEGETLLRFRIYGVSEDGFYIPKACSQNIEFIVK